MADILIRGMEMPENCGECPFYRLEGAGNGMYWDYCAGKRGIVYDPDNKRENDCPLIALPDGHGRLVDADKLMRHYAWWGECEQRELFDSIVEQQNTIVPAEEDEK